MGADLDAGVLVFSGVSILTTVGPLGSAEESMRVVTIKARRRGAKQGADSEESLTFEMSRAQFARLAEDFREYGEEA